MADGGAVASGAVIVTGGTGGTSSVSSNGVEYIKATGGTGGYIKSVYGSHHSNVHGKSNPIGGVGGSPNGKNGRARFDYNEQDAGSVLQPGAGWQLGFAGASGTYGRGGYARHKWNVRNVWICSATGGSGGYNTTYISVTPGQKLTINVGAGGRKAVDMDPRAASSCSAEPGQTGYVYIEYNQKLYEDVLTVTNTEDPSATDKVAPAILELFLNGILGDTSKYEIGMVSEDYGTTYEHYITGENKTYNMKVTSNIVKTDVITGIAGYSWKIDSNSIANPDNTIGYDNDGNRTSTFPKTIATSYLDRGYYLHAKAIDKAGNIGETVHLELETTTITLTSHYNEYADSRGYGPDYIPLTWTNSNPNNRFSYQVYAKAENEILWKSRSTHYDKPVKVLNIYPNVGNQLKGWMERPNAEEPKGYGKGLISVDEVRITDFNYNPTAYLKQNGKYKYDVIMFGSWDCNNNYDISWAAARATEEFIKAGRGVLFGHDTICGREGLNHTNFNYLAHYLCATPTRDMPRIGSSTVQVVKKGFLTKYPYDIETRKLWVPYCHTSSVRVNSDIWIKFRDIGGPLTDGEDKGTNNYYLASWNNCAFIRTGHSNGAATPDEQKILANVLFYLGQVTEDTYMNDPSRDLAAPEISNVEIADKKQANKLELSIEGIDYGTGYDYYVAGKNLKTAGIYYSNTVHTVVKTGIQKFQYTINSSSTEYTGTQYETPAVNKESCKINIDKGYIGQYLHIRAVDNAGNVGAVTHIYLDGARTISREEKDATKELYCIEQDVLIPAENDGTQQDATVEVAGNRETLKWPLNIQKLFELYKEDGVALRNPYTTSGQSGFVDKSNSLGRYLLSSVPGTQTGKRGNASEVYAYILSHYKDNITGNSDSQNALYEIIAEENGITGDSSRRNLLYYEAKEYGKFRNIIKQKGSFFTKQVTHKVRVGYNVENNQFIIGPFEVEYIRNYSNIADATGNSKKVEFSGIGVASGTSITNKNGIRIYDQNGKEINQGTWSIEYDNKNEKEKTRNETYAEYEMPLSGEEFYIKLNRTGNENVTSITKIEVQYYEMEADAQYGILSGVYSTVEWNANQSSNICEGGTMCPHDRSYQHTIGHTYYITSRIAAANLKSQRLLEINWAKREYKTYVQTLEITADKGTNNDPGGTDPGDNPPGGNDDEDNGGTIEDTIRLTMNFSGNIWNDQSENICNGLKEIGELGIKGVEVFLIDQGTGIQVDYTVTDEKGEYIFKQVPVGRYYIEYTYDGQTYRTTRSFVQGTVEDYRTNGNGKAYTNISIVDETKDAREKFNNRFYEIKKRAKDGNRLSGEAIDTNGQKRTLNYKEIGTTSKIITREEGSEKAYQDFQIGISTKEKEIYFPATNKIVINETPYLLIDDNNSINVGLATREKTDQNLRLDVYQTTFSIKGQRQSFLHNGKEIRDINSNKIVNEYIQKVNPDDYAWRLENYKNQVSEEVYEEIKDIYGSGADCELEAYVEYMIILRNSGLNDTAYITEIADYFDKTLEYRDQYRDFDMSSWIIIRNDDDTESECSGNNSKEQIKWSKDSRYGDTNEYSDKFNKMYANLEEYGIKKGQYAEIHIVFRVLKDAEGNILLDAGEGKQNAAEINGYRTRYTETGEIAGLIDIDSKPGDLNPTEEEGVYEDDEDKAPSYKLQLGYTNISDNGGDNSGEESPGGDNEGDGDSIKTDENGNIIGFGNTIEGNVWEDIKEITIEEDGRKISNGVKEEPEEQLINDIKVELIETIGGRSKTNNKYKEIEINLSEKDVENGNETRTQNKLLLTEKGKKDGAYRFSHLSGGKYKVRFTYGDEKQLEKNIKYNGQDYQAISSAKIFDADKLAGSYEDSEIMLVIDSSNSMNGNKMTMAKNAANQLIDKLKAKLPGIKIGVVNFHETANTIGNVNANSNNLKNKINQLGAGGETAIGKGIEEARNDFRDGKNKLMVIITDGQETVETEEAVITQIEQLKTQGINLVSVLTGKSDNIFGTENKPRYGEVYTLLNEEEIYGKITNDIYQEAIKISEVEQDRSLGRDLEYSVDGIGTKEQPAKGTRAWQINEYSEMTYKKGTVLNIEEIANMKESAEKVARIKELANTTYMISETKPVEFTANNVGADKIHEVNQALVERPKAKLNLAQEIAGIKVTLSDGSVIIDTAKGLSKNVMGLDVPKAPVSIYMDEEIMQGATVEVTYTLNVTNTSDVDRLSNYFEGESDATITSTAKVIYAYLNNNIVYREESQHKEGTEEGEEPSKTWEVVNLKDNKGEMQDELSPNTIDKLQPEITEDIENGTKMTLRTESLKEQKLYPMDSKEVKLGEGNYKSEISADLVLSKVISPEDDQTLSLTYECAMEITVRGNEVGRRVLGAIPGNHRIVDINQEGTTISLEPDEAVSRKIAITKPLGENRDKTYILIALSVTTAVAVAIIIIGKKKK